MAWFAAHAVLYCELTDGPQDNYQVYENVFLVQADTPAEAWDKARAFARRDEGDSDGTLRVGGRPAREVFGGIRRLMSVTHEKPGDQLGDGDELTYSCLVVDDRAALDKLIRDEDVEVLYARGPTPADFETPDSGPDVH